MIYKFQDGGASVPPFVSFTPVTVTRPRATDTSDSGNRSNSSSKSDDLSLKDVLKLIEEKIDALPNDASYIIQGARQFFASPTLSVSPFGGSQGYNTSAIAMQYLNLLDNITKAKHFKKEYDEAFKIVRDNGGYNEVAVTTSGHLICQDPETGEFQLMTPREQKESGYIALTNSQLLDLRALAPENAMNIDLIKTVANGVGTETISKFIESRLSNLGKDKLEREGYSRTEANKIVEGINYLQQAAATVGDAALAQGAPMTIDGIYKYTTLSETQTNQAIAAMNYIFTTMPNNMKAVLEVKAEQMGINKDNRGVYNLIFQYIGSKVSDVNSVKISATKGNDGSDNIGKNAIDNIALTGAQLAQANYGPWEMNVMQSGTPYAYEVPTQRMVISGLGASANFLDVSKSSDAGAFNFTDATMGGQKLDPTKFDQAIVNANDVNLVYLPIDLNELQQHNVIQPDLALLKKMEAVAQAINQIPGDHNPKDKTFRDKANAIYKNATLPVYYDDNGDVILSHYRKFAAFDADVLKDAIPESDDMGMWEVIRDEDHTKEIYGQINSYRGKGRELQFKKRSPIYRGIIYVPFNNNFMSTVQSANRTVTAGQAVQIEALQQQRDRLNSQGGYHAGYNYFEN